MKYFWRLGALAGFAVGSAFAVDVPITNPGFEMQTVNDGTFIDNGAPTGWSAYDPNGIIGNNYSSLGVLNPTGTTLYPGGAPERSNVALVFLWPYDPDTADAGKLAGIQQTLSTTLQANMQYTLSVQVGNIAPGGPAPFDLSGFPGYQVQLLAGNTLLAQDNNSLSPGEGMWTLSTVEFSTGATPAQLGDALTIRLINLNAPDAGIEVNFDDVHLDAVAVPEPAVWFLPAVGAVLVCARRYFRADRLTGSRADRG
jgi:hapalindole H/12-epi-hapalindole U/12-epi-fischerindole U synthase